MSWLILILHVFVGTTLAGVGIVAVLVTGYGTALPILGAIAVGYVLAISMSVLIAQAMYE